MKCPFLSSIAHSLIKLRCVIFQPPQRCRRHYTAQTHTKWIRRWLERVHLWRSGVLWRRGRLDHIPEQSRATEHCEAHVVQPESDRRRSAGQHTVHRWSSYRWVQIFFLPLSTSEKNVQPDADHFKRHQQNSIKNAGNYRSHSLGFNRHVDMGGCVSDQITSIDIFDASVCGWFCFSNTNQVLFRPANIGWVSYFHTAVNTQHNRSLTESRKFFQRPDIKEQAITQELFAELVAKLVNFTPHLVCAFSSGS